ncbi:MAG: GDSL-type esterase/lipase family protein [Candidatus Sphingomonas colombiensis]|nr:GDSL-type esterase/lipase family protein [Sphingomonas sp.]WEK44057.1 MAG: GDSL-type esterase/lipase family protein [Sphingomonas sp.]
MIGTLIAAMALGAQGAPTAPQPMVGVLADPCTALPPIPAVVADYMARYARAKAANQPPPPASADGMAIYQRWQDQLRASDFAGLCRYHAENAALPPASKDRIIFFGDSITELWQREDPDFFTADRIDRGVSGQTTLQMIARFRADVIDLKPATVHIMAGTNDIAGNTGPTTLAAIEGNIRSMSELARAHNIRVVLASVPPAARFDWRPGVNPVDDIRALNAWLADYARREKLTYIDYYSALQDAKHGFRAEWSEDGVHPNQAGYIVMRGIAEKALRLRPRARN